MQPQICYDVTHTVARLGLAAPSGIDKVDLAYGRHYAARRYGPGIHYGRSLPQVLELARLNEIVDLALQTRWERLNLEHDATWLHLLAGLNDATLQFESPPKAVSTVRRPASLPEWRRLSRPWRRDGGARVPSGAVYLNVAQFWLEHPRYFLWLYKRPDVRPVFFIHDLLPLDIPEFFRDNEQALFERRIATAVHYAKGFITSTRAVAARLEAECRCRGYPAVPIHIEPLPSTLTDTGLRPLAGQAVPALAAVSYFVALGTIEARKNHLLLLDVWRAMAEDGGPVPRLVIVGARGWGNAQVLDILDRSPLVGPHVSEVSGLSSPALARLLANARALLMPSFDEGYGLPLVEALTLGTPVIATDKPVFREVTQGCATYLHYLDGSGWRKAIEELASGDGAAWGSARQKAASFSAPTWESYFERVDLFLKGLGAEP